jgi:protein TonB
VLQVQGKSVLAVLIDKDGIARNLRILRPLGAGLDAKAVQAVQTWKFWPAEKNGQPVTVEIAIETSFHLK